VLQLCTVRRDRAVDSAGATRDFLLSAKQDAATAKRFQSKSAGRSEPSRAAGGQHRRPRRVTARRRAAQSPRRSRRGLPASAPVPYLNNVLEQDHRAIKRRVNASQHFRSFWGAWRTIAGYEAIHMIRKGQACWSAVGAKVGLLHRFIVGMFGNGSLIHLVIAPTARSIPKLQHYPLDGPHRLVASSS
jgi:transposase, IS6 family